MDLNPDFRNASFNFIFQVWRPSSSVNTTGCYDLVDDFLSSSISIATQPESKRVARVIPAPQDQLQFQPGDVLGFYVESYGSTDKSDYDNGVVVLNNGSHSSELVWFASVDITAARHSKSGMQSCPYPVGTNGVLSSSTHAAPVISISVVATPCPQMIVTSSLSFALYPTLAVTEHEFEDPLGSSSTNQLVWISVAIVVAAILCTVVAMTVICCIKHHKKGTMPILTDDRDRCEQLHSMETVKLENNQAYGKFSHIHKTDSMENVTYATIESISPSIELKENAAYSMLELRQS